MNATNSTRTLVMVIADSTAVSAIRCNQLAMAGYQTIQVDNIEEAHYALENRCPPVVLLMPGEQKHSFVNWLAQLRKVQPLEYLPILVEVSPGDDALRCEYLEQGADSVISPQTSPKEISAGVRALLRAKELHDALSSSRQELQNSLQRERKLMEKLKTDNDDLRQQCQTDPLTHATNAESYRRMLEHDFHLSKRYNHTMSLLVIDVDRFKNVNDTYGHPCGDMVLKELTVILQRAVRQADVVARTGGEEFAVILPRTDAAAARLLAERLRQEVAQTHFWVYGQDVSITLSIGMATYPTDAEITEPPMMEYLADQCLLWAKQHGRNQTVTLGELSAQARHRMRRQYLGVPVAEEVAKE